MDWTGGLTLKIIFMLSNDTRTPVGLCGGSAALFLVIECQLHCGKLMFINNKYFVYSVASYPGVVEGRPVAVWSRTQVWWRGG